MFSYLRRSYWSRPNANRCFVLAISLVAGRREMNDKIAMQRKKKNDETDENSMSFHQNVYAILLRPLFIHFTRKIVTQIMQYRMTRWQQTLDILFVPLFFAVVLALCHFIPIVNGLKICRNEHLIFRGMCFCCARQKNEFVRNCHRHQHIHSLKWKTTNDIRMRIYASNSNFHSFSFSVFARCQCRDKL